MAQPIWQSRIVGEGEEDPEALLANPFNFRVHPKPQQAALNGALDSLGWIQRILVNRTTGHVVDGHLRIELALSTHQPTVPVSYVELSEDEEKLALLTLDPIAAMAASDKEALEALLADVQTEDPALSAMLDDLAKGAGIGLGTADEAEDVPPSEDRAEELRAKWGTAAGQLWEIGKHRLLVGDCRSPADVEHVMGGERVNVAFTSPPYADRRTYDQTTEFRPIPPDEYVEWFAPVAENVASVLVPDGSWFVNIKAASDGLDTETYVLDLVLAHARLWGWHWATEFCWERPGTPGQAVRRFKNQFEPIYQFTRSEWKFRPASVKHESDHVPMYDPAANWVAERRQGEPRNGPSRASYARQTSDDLAYPGNRLPTFAGSHKAIGHAAAFPPGLPAWFFQAFSDPGDVMFDPCCGSGSSLVAAEKTGRLGRGIEISPGYVAISLERLSALSLTPKLLTAAP